jgi:hypothetical protein
MATTAKASAEGDKLLLRAATIELICHEDDSHGRSYYFIESSVAYVREAAPLRFCCDLILER